MNSFNRALARLAQFTQPVLRLTLGFIMFWHGKGKFFDGDKLDGVKGFFTFLKIPVPGVTAPAVAVLELVGGLLIIAGVLTRLVSVLFIVQLIFALIYFKYGKSIGLIAAQENGAGAELDWALIAGFFALAARGAGRWAVDHKLGWDHLKHSEPQHAHT